MNGGNNNPLKLAKAIAKARKKAGLTQQQLCVKANLSYSTLAKIERGAIKTPSVFTVVAIAVATDTTVESLTGYGLNSSIINNPKDYKTSTKGIKYIYFDVNGVLVRFFQRAFTHIAADTGAPVEAIESLYWHYDDLVCRGEVSLQEFNTKLANRIGVPSIEWQKYYLQNIDPIKEMAETLKWVNKHYKIGLLTNTMPELIPNMIKSGTLPQVDYHAIIDSSVYKTIKPEQKIFEIATHKSGSLPKEILFIDDSRQNLMAAEKIGWNVLWFDDYHPSESVARIHEWLQF